MTENEQIINQVVEKVLEAQRFRNGAWTRVIEEGRKYALMKGSGCYVENEKLIKVSFSDVESYTRMFQENLLRYVEDAVVEDTLVGMAIPSNKTGI